MVKILLIGASISENFGGPSILESIVELYENLLDNTEFVLMSPTGKKDSRYAKQYHVNIINRPNPKQRALLWLVSVFKNLGIDVSSFLKNETLIAYKAFSSSDIIIDLWGIIYAEQTGGGFRKRFLEGIHIPTGKNFRKPVIKYTADIGPFTSFWNRFFAKRNLNKCDYIIARNEISKQNLLRLGVMRPVDVCPDTAFVMKPRQDHYLKSIIGAQKSKGRMIIGLSVSHTIEEKEASQNQYSDCMSRTIKYLNNKYDAAVILIPNNVFEGRHDDLAVAKKIFQTLDLPVDSVIVVDRECIAPELKAIINDCDIMIAARYHSIVASLSLGIPTLAISWHHKYSEVLNLFGQEKYLCEIRTLTFENVIAVADDLIVNREKVRSEIGHHISEVISAVVREREIIQKNFLAGQSSGK